MSKPSISVFFPAYNDGGTIASLVIEADRTCRALTDDYEIIVVENGSTDYTVEVLEELTPQFEHLRSDPRFVSLVQRIAAGDQPESKR